MNCPKCKFEKPQEINQSKTHIYCPKCQHVWVKGKEAESLTNQGTVDFEGVPQAKMILEMLGKEIELSSPLKAALLAQVTNTLWEQWFEGFKGGLLANIVKEMENDNGKDSTGAGSSDREYRDGTGSLDVKEDEDRFGQRAHSGPGKTFERVKETVAGVTFYRPKSLGISEEAYADYAVLIQGVKKGVFDFAPLGAEVDYSNVEVEAGLGEVIIKVKHFKEGFGI